MTITLTSFPQAIWHDVLINWLDSLRDIACLDCACRLSSKVNPLQSIYAGKAFPFQGTSDEPDMMVENALSGLCSWMRARKVYISRLTLVKGPSLPPPHWALLISWSADTLVSLSCSFSSSRASAMIIAWASSHLKRLQKLYIKGAPPTDSGVMEKLLQNNAQTLTSVIAENCAADLYVGLYNKGTKYPALQLLSWTHLNNGNLCGMLTGCGSLVALDISSSRDYPALITTIATHCPLLQSLRIVDCVGYPLDDTLLLQLARGCPLLQYLGLWNCFYARTLRFAEAMSALPNLCVLNINTLREEELLYLAARGHPTLHIVDTSAEFTYDGLRRVTAALPQLTGLSVGNVSLPAEAPCLDLLQYCGNLEHLELSVYVTPEVNDAALQSAALYCPNLHTLTLDSYTGGNTKELNAVLQSCPKLRRLQTANYQSIQEPDNCPGLVVSNDYVALSNWQPEWLK